MDVRFNDEAGHAEKYADSSTAPLLKISFVGIGKRIRPMRRIQGMRLTGNLLLWHSVTSGSTYTKIIDVPAHDTTAATVSAHAVTAGWNQGRTSCLMMRGGQMKSKHIRLILVGSSALWLAFASVCFGASYYFDATLGDDHGAGTSPYDPWKTEAKFNATRFSPGDTIYFKRGETWNSDALYLHNSGTAGKVITLTAYGTGTDPALSRIVSGARTGTADYWSIKNVIVTNHNGYACIEIVGYAANLTIKDSVIHGCAGRGISVESLVAGDSDNLLIQDVTVYNNGNQGIHVEDSTGTNNIKGVVVQRVTSYGNGTNGPDNLDGITVGGLTGGVVQYCKSFGNNGDGVDLGGASIDSVVQYNLVYNNTGSGIVVSNTANNTLVIGNVAHHNETGMHIKKPTNNTKAYNNTLVFNSDYGAMLATTNSVTLKNNILAHNSYGPWNPIVFTHASKQKLVSDYNLFWHPIHPGSEFYDHDIRTHYSFALWQARGYDTHSLNVDPDLDANYVPKPNSPAIGAGVNLGAAYRAILNPASSWTANVSTLDQDDFGSWDIGAYRSPSTRPSSGPLGVSRITRR